MAKFTLIGMAATEFSCNAASPEDAARLWRRFHRRHPRARKGQMRVLFLLEKPAVVDGDGRQHELDWPAVKRLAEVGS